LCLRSFISTTEASKSDLSKGQVMQTPNSVE
jgi:hypothetical protein